MSISPTGPAPAATPTLGKSKELPPGIAKKVDSGGVLPPGIAKRFAAQLPPSAPATGPAPAEPTADAAPGGGETLDIRA